MLIIYSISTYAAILGYWFYCSRTLAIIIISVVAQLLLYRLLTAGNLVNVTLILFSTGVTALMDYIFLAIKCLGLTAGI